MAAQASQSVRLFSSASAPPSFGRANSAGASCRFPEDTARILLHAGSSVLRILFAAILTVHALIHFLGVAKGFEFARLNTLRMPISRAMAIVWLGAGVMLLAAVVALFVKPQWFWAIGALGLVLSQIVIISSWGDARFGTIANVLLLGAVVHGAFARGPFGLRTEYERLVRAGISSTAAKPPSHVVTEADLSPLPPAVQRYLRFTGVVGTRRPVGFRARLTGRIRGSATAEWMPLEVEQVNFYNPPRRYFWMNATRGGLPVDGLHAYGETEASMRVRLLSLIPVVDQHGPDMMRTETVTVLNDMAVFAPAALLDASIHWREIDATQVEATYTNGPNTIRAVLVFADTGALVDFWSDDRPALAEDGKTMIPQRWSTPLRDYRTMGPYRLATHGEARYTAASGEYTYLELEIHDVSTELR